MSDAREWADKGIAELIGDIREDAEEFPLTQEEAVTLMRAAYAEGYIAALKADGTTATDKARRRAWTRAEELRLRIPVD